MYFTEGQLRKYERMMQEKPKYEAGSAEQSKDRDCENCLYFNAHSKKCSRDKCIVFDD